MARKKPFTSTGRVSSKTRPTSFENDEYIYEVIDYRDFVLWKMGKINTLPIQHYEIGAKNQALKIGQTN